MKLAINLVTRGRPDVALDTIAKTAGNIRLPDTVMMVSMDADDQKTIDAVHYPGLLLSIREREDSVGAKWNRVLAEVPDADIYLPMSDDSPVITPGFDEKIVRAASRWPDGIGLVVDYLDTITTCSCQAISRKFAGLMGHIYPECFPYWFTDPWLLDIAKILDRFAFVDIRFDHTLRIPTLEFREPAWWATFFDACHLKRRDIAHDIIRNHLDEPDWRKAILLERHPLVEAYTKLASDNVRRLRLAEQPADARYIRTKDAAAKMLRDDLLPSLRQRHNEVMPDFKGCNQ